MEQLFSWKEQIIDTYYKTDAPQKYYVEWKKPDTKDDALYNPIYKEFL